MADLSQLAFDIENFYTYAEPMSDNLVVSCRTYANRRAKTEFASLIKKDVLVDNVGLASLGIKTPSRLFRSLGKKSLIKAALAPVAEDLQVVKESLPSYFEGLHGSAKEIIHYVFDGQGKHIRPAIFLMTAQMLDYSGTHLIPIASVCEFVHTASLLHDDVVDNSSLRRNKKTSNAIFGDESAVLVGDLIYATASEILAKTGYLELVGGFARAIRKMSEGELIQLDNSYNWQTTESTYYEILSGKTGVLMGMCCRAAGILAQLSPREKDALEQFGHGLGIAFQMIDDSLDFQGDQRVLGKASLADLKEGRITLPLILLRDLATSQEWEKTTTLLSQEPISDAALTYVASLVSKYRCAQKTVALAEEKTEQNINLLRENFANSPMRHHLEGLAKLLVERVV